MTTNNSGKTIKTTEVSDDGSTVTFTVNTNGGNYNHKVQGTVVQGDVYEGGIKQPKV